LSLPPRYRRDAGGGVRAVLGSGGIRDALAKSLGTTNPINMLKAAEAALRQLPPAGGSGQGARKQISKCPLKGLQHPRRWFGWRR
jgi:ribosomal protein S5